MNANRELRQKIFIAVHDFLEDHFDCDCPRIDPDGSHTAEALKLTEAILDVVNAQEVWEDDPYVGELIADAESLRKWQWNATLYSMAMQRLSERKDL